MKRTVGERGPRRERDEIGEVEIPAGALWGIETARSLVNLSFSGRTLSDCGEYLDALLLVKQATARANREAGVLSPATAEAISGAAAVILGGEWRDQFPVDPLGGGGAIGVHQNVNEVLACLASRRRQPPAPVDPKREVNASQSTADVCHTALRLAILRAFPRLEEAWGNLERTLEWRRRELGAIPTLARTCLQDALPTTFDVLLGGWQALLRRRRRELAAAVAPLRSVVLGGTVLGTGEGASPAYRERVVPILAEVAGVQLEAHPDPASALQAGDDVVALSGALLLAVRGLGKMAQDLRLLSSGPRGGFGEVELPYVQAGSSFFGRKNNPVIPETVLQGAILVEGADAVVRAAAARAEVHLHVFDSLAALHVLDAVGQVTRLTERFDIGCLRELQAHEARCRDLATPEAGRSSSTP